MSRNFELLTQIDYELDGTDQRTRLAGDHAVVRTTVADKPCGKEILRLVQSVFLSTDVSAPRQVVFCGVEGENGSSTVVAGAGRTLASNSVRSVCMVDANVQSPCLSNIFGVDTTIPFPGRPASVRERCTQITDNLWLAGTDMLGNDRGALASVDEVRHLLAQLRSVFDYVLIDAPGTKVCRDAAILGQIADAAVLVVEANSTRRQTARKAKETLNAAGVRLFGTVLNNRTYDIPDSIYRRL